MCPLDEEDRSALARAPVASSQRCVYRCSVAYVASQSRSGARAMDDPSPPLAARRAPVTVTSQGALPPNADLGDALVVDDASLGAWFRGPPAFSNISRGQVADP